MAEQHVHVDPEFETFTYGDPTVPKRSLRDLRPGDLLVFYCGLQRWDAMRDDEGATVIEYAILVLMGFLMAGLVAAAVTAAVTTRSNQIK